jgi:L-seryl-tRNA(Ser) seleniumtransferase
MNPVPESAAKPQKDSGARLRAIPSVDELLLQPRLVALAKKSGRALVTQTVRQVLAEFRTRLKSEPLQSVVPNQETFDSAQFEPRAIAQIANEVVAAVVVSVIAKVEAAVTPSLRRVINATGVVLHTNLGRAPLSHAAVGQINATAAGYSNLEYDLVRGERGKRDVHTARLLAELVGAESAIVVNNNAAAVFLVLNALAKGAEVIVSRGELIEIGDGFRIPDIMNESGAALREVGTTNRTRLRDYERAITDRTRLLLRVHPSNFRITGFTERPSLAELVALGERFHLPVYEDLGSGCIADLSASGIAEPVARASCEAGASVISISGDKLLGGPQAGIIAGKKGIVDRIRANPLFRALRVDKLTIAALEATLQSYLRGAFDEIPTLRMIRLSQEEIAIRAQNFCEKFRPALPADVKLETHPGFSVIGGGSTPDQQLPTTLIAVSTPRHSAAELEDRLRKPRSSGPEAGTSSTTIPVIARIENGQVLLDLRTVHPNEETEIAAALVASFA